jgi:peptidoglycan/LPS O-acetylase OafA/YrhL
MRIEQLTFTRFVAAISIVVYHFGMVLFPFRTDAFSFLFRQANLGVSYFFILSGFVMIIAYGGNGNSHIDRKKYYLSRIARIYPVYFIALFLLFVYYIVRSKPVDAVGYAMNLFVIQSWFPPYPLTGNGPGWSLAIEFFFYALFPLLFNKIYSRFKLPLLAVSILLFWVFSQVIFNLLINSSFYQGFPSKSHDLLYYFPLMHLNEFLIGNLGGMILLKTSKSKMKNYDALLILLLVVLILLLRFPLPWSYHNGLLAIIFIPFVLLLSRNKGPITYLFKRRPLIFLGEISYGIYILQIPVYYWSKGFLKFTGIKNEYLLFFLPLLILIALAGISYEYMETPIRNWVKQKYAGKAL